MRKLTPYICCKDAARALDFYARAFGAKETMRLSEPDGRVGHAEIEIGGDVLMIADEFPDYGVRGPKTIGGTPVRLHLYVDRVDDVVARAVEAGAKVIRPVQDQFYGDRSGVIEDPSGHVWMLATKKEDLTVGEIQRRYDDMSKDAEAK